MNTTAPGRPLSVRLATHRCTPDAAASLKQILARHPGDRPVHLLLVSGHRTTAVALDPALSVTDSPALHGELRRLLGG
jgi:hypothetical protein